MPAYFATTVNEFLACASDQIESRLTRAYEADRFKELMVPQFAAWREEIEILQEVFRSEPLSTLDIGTCGIAFEFVIPRRMGRVDVVLLLGEALVALEFKTHAQPSSAADQVEDYSLDLLHFHKPSHGRTIYPVVVDVHGSQTFVRNTHLFHELQPTRITGRQGLRALIAEILQRDRERSQLDIQTWNIGAYHPVPTIVEAAVGMFAEMEVSDIAKADCDPINLSATIERIQKIAAETKDANTKTVCFVTGVPGAGKTLAGLRVVHDRMIQERLAANAVFLTGNLPLVEVLRSALSRDLAQRKKQHLRASTRNPKTTIDTVLGYKKTHTETKTPPAERVVVFDEAQRAWTAKKTEKYLREKDPLRGYSEPELMMAILDRHDWAVLIALVGGGQEINDGEAGIGEWGRSLERRFKHWNVAVSPQALDGGYGAGAKLFESTIPDDMHIAVYRELHLDNPLRQYRGKTVAIWAEALLAGDAEQCRRTLADNPDFPVALTRDLSTAKAWLQNAAIGSERYGFIASSQARRLRAEGLELQPARADGVEHWFLGPKGDVRSSYQLEVAANEFQIQGLEIDWACLCWGGDFLKETQSWALRRFVGTTWQKVNSIRDREYVLNTYRVLLTRARRGLLLYVPQGNADDVTRASEPLDRTAAFLESCGASLI